MFTLTEKKGCPGINAAADSLWSVKLLTRIVGKSSLTKKRHRITFEKKKCKFNTQENEKEKTEV